jgi:hypothetical protein
VDRFRQCPSTGQILLAWDIVAKTSGIGFISCLVGLRSFKIISFCLWLSMMCHYTSTYNGIRALVYCDSDNISHSMLFHDVDCVVCVSIICTADGPRINTHRMDP